LTEHPVSGPQSWLRHSSSGRRAVRVELKGIHRVSRRLAKGKRVHYYAWRGGPKITAEPGTPEFVEQYNEAHRSRRKPDRSTFSTLIAEFKASGEYAGLSKPTKKDYSRYFKLIESDFGDLPIVALSEPAMRGEFKAWRDRMADTPRKADYAWTTLARILSVAKDRGRISVNPCERGGRLYDANRADKIWSEAEIIQILKSASAELQLALMLALWTGQRQGDLIGLTWSAYDGTHIRLTQSKSNKPLVVRVGFPLKALLDRTKRRSTHVLTNSRGVPWTSDGFRTSWGKLCDRVGIKDLTFHDLRGSTVTRLALEGSPPQEIASVTGHSLSDVCDILEKHYLGERAGLAEMAIKRLERKERQKNKRSLKAVNGGVNRSDVCDVKDE
jgi:integrase